MNYFKFIRTYPRHISYSLAHSFFSGIGQTFLIALFVPSIREQFGLKITQFDLLYSLATLTSASLVPSIGRQIDLIHLRTYSFFTGLLLILSTLLIGSSSHLVFLFAGFVLLRLSGQSLMSHIASTAMARYFHDVRGRALGLSSLGHPMGEAILPLTVVNLILWFGWRTAFLILGVLVLLVFFPLIFFLFHRDDEFLRPAALKKVEAIDKDEFHLGRKEVLKTPYFYFVTPLSVAPGFLATALFLHQADIAAYKGWTVQWMATCFVGFAILRVLGAFLSGPLIDRFSAKRLFPFQLLPMAGGLLLLALFKHPLINFAYLSLMGLSIGFEFSLKSALWAEVYGTRHLGAIRSLALSIVIYSTAVSPVLSGWLIEKGVNIDHIILGAVAFIVAASLLSSLAPPVRRGTVGREKKDRR